MMISLLKKNVMTLLRYCVDAPYYYGETDNDDTPVTGLVHNLGCISQSRKNTWRTYTFWKILWIIE